MWCMNHVYSQILVWHFWSNQISNNLSMIRGCQWYLNSAPPNKNTDQTTRSWQRKYCEGFLIARCRVPPWYLLTVCYVRLASRWHLTGSDHELTPSSLHQVIDHQTIFYPSKLIIIRAQQSNSQTTTQTPVPGKLCLFIKYVVSIIIIVTSVNNLIIKTSLADAGGCWHLGGHTHHHHARGHHHQPANLHHHPPNIQQYHHHLWLKASNWIITTYQIIQNMC